MNLDQQRASLSTAVGPPRVERRVSSCWWQTRAGRSSMMLGYVAAQVNATLRKRGKSECSRRRRGGSRFVKEKLDPRLVRGSVFLTHSTNGVAMAGGTSVNTGSDVRRSWLEGCSNPSLGEGAHQLFVGMSKRTGIPNLGAMSNPLSNAASAGLGVELPTAPGLDRGKGPISGYMSVLRTLISAFIASYALNNQTAENTLNLILDILSEIYHGEDSLCMQFWDRDSFVDEPIRSLLYMLESRYPFHIGELVHLLSSLCSGMWSAECVNMYRKHSNFRFYRRK